MLTIFIIRLSNDSFKILISVATSVKSHFSKVHFYDHLKLRWRICNHSLIPLCTRRESLMSKAELRAQKGKK